MGLGPRFSTCAAHPASPPATSRPPAPAGGNPDPRRFSFESLEQIGAHVVAVVRYPDATNYEGLKVLLIRRTTPAVLRATTVLDPHFCDGGHLSPFARFEPTPAGIDAARRLAALLD